MTRVRRSPLLLVALLGSGAFAACARSARTVGSPGESAPVGAGPILDTHIHLYQPSRPGGVPWPRAEQRALYRDTLALDYERAARPLGITGAVVVEASPLHDDTRWVLAQIRGSGLLRFYVAQLEIGAPDFPSRLEEIAGQPAVVGIRGFLWSPKLNLEPTQIAHLRALADRGMTLDLVSRRTLNPKPQIVALARAVPELRVVIDHLGGARGPGVDPGWAADMRLLAAEPNLHLKVSSLFDMYNPATTEIEPWPAPTAAAAYRPHFEVVLAAFGPERLIWGSNWPVCNLGGSLAAQVRITEELLAPHGRAIRDQVMYTNALRFYQRRPR